MTKALILEDEPLTAERLIQLLAKQAPEITVIDVLEGIADARIWFDNNAMPDIVFMDIHLSDASVFDLFKYVSISAPIIFTTAYDEYAIKAFEVNSIAYLLKPISPKALQQALDKLKHFKQTLSPLDISMVQQLLQQKENHYKQRFLVRIGQQYKHLSVDDILWFKFQEGQVFAYTQQQREYPIELSISKLAQVLNPHIFFHINRAYIVRISAIKKIHTWFNQRLKLDIQGIESDEVIVSRDKVAAFKQWLDS